MDMNVDSVVHHIALSKPYAYMPLISEKFSVEDQIYHWAIQFNILHNAINDCTIVKRKLFHDSNGNRKLGTILVIFIYYLYQNNIPHK
jgi:hypothetical protein